MFWVLVISFGLVVLAAALAWDRRGRHRTMGDPPHNEWSDRFRPGGDR